MTLVSRRPHSAHGDTQYTRPSSSHRTLIGYFKNRLLPLLVGSPIKPRANSTAIEDNPIIAGESPSLLFTNRTTRDSKATAARRRNARNSRPNLEVLDPRLCLAQVFLDFETPNTGSSPTVPTSFGTIELQGFYEPSRADSDLESSGHGGNVLQSSPQSNQFGTGAIRIKGGLGSSIKFYYGTRNQITDETQQGGFTGYTYTKSLAEINSQPEPEDVFKQFSLSFLQPIGPQTLNGPLLGPHQFTVANASPSNDYLATTESFITKNVEQDGKGLFNAFFLDERYFLW